MRQARTFLAAFALIGAQAQAQNESDVLRYSQQDIAGTLRNMGMGGTVGAVGADLSCAFSNPAGLGLYRRGDIGFHWGFSGMKTGFASGEFSQRGNAANAPVAQAGLAITYPSIHPDWPFVTLAVSYQKRTDLHQQILAEGVTLNGSLLDLFRDQAAGMSPAELQTGGTQFTSHLAWEAFLLDPDPGQPACATCYVTALQGAERVAASKRIERDGTVGETAIAFAANYRNRLYLGGAIGLPRVEFSETILHQESPLTDSTAVTDWSFNEQLDVEGSGLNARLGFLWAATDWLRIGANWASRSRLALRDTYATDIAANWFDGTATNFSSPLNRFEYVIYTPARFAVNTAFIMGKYGIVSAEYERTDFRQGELRPSAFSGPSAYAFEAENQAVERIHTVAHAARVGAEFRIARDYRLRLGAGIAPSPYSQAANTVTDATRYHGSLGWAYRGPKWYAGASYILTGWSEDLRPWGLPMDNPVATLQRRNGMFAIGVGARL